MRSNYVDLQRKFAVYREKTPAEESLYFSELLVRPSDELGWDQLIEKSRVVVLGEPGSGKSTEFEEKSKALADQGAFSLLISLSDVIGTELATILSPEDTAATEAWRSSRSPGYLFLDSVDESRLRSYDDFRRALQSIRRAFRIEEINRLHIYISSRATAWRSVSDMEMVRETLGPFKEFTETAGIIVGNTRLATVFAKSDTPAAELHEGDPEPIDCYHIVNLTLEQVRSYAQAIGISNAEQFTTELVENHAQEFAKRPADVEVLAKYWRRNGNLGSLMELMESHVKEQVQESPERRSDDTVPIAKLRLGAEQLAAVNIMARKTEFSKPFDERQIGEGLSAISGLPGWSEAELNALLMRPIFDSEFFGRIHFHHRNTTEYLAACWFRRLLEGGMQLPALVKIIFKRLPNGLVLRPSLAPIAAWLCCFTGSWNDPLRVLMLEHAPETFLLYGDPRQLTADYRGRVLERLVQRLNTRNHALVENRPQVLCRLADEAHVPAISAIIRDQKLGRSVRRFAFLVAVYGKLVGTVNAALDALESDETDPMNDYALEVVRLFADKAQRERLAAWADHAKSIPLGWIHEIAECVYPDVVDERRLAHLFAKTIVGDDRRFTSTYSLRRFVSEIVPQERLTSLLAAIMELLDVPPYIGTEPGRQRVSHIHVWLLPLLVPLLERVLQQSDLESASLPIYARALGFIDELRTYQMAYEDSKTDFTVLTQAHRSLRRAFLEYLVLSRTKDSPATFVFHMAGSRGLASIDVEDAPWLISLLSTSDNERLREAALYALEMLFEKSKRPLRLRRQILKASVDSSRLSQHARLSTQIGPIPHIKRFWYRRVVFTMGESSWWRLRQHDLQRRWQSIKNFYTLHRHIGVLRSGRRPDWLAFVLTSARLKDSGSSKLGSRDWEELRAVYGDRLSRAIMEGCDRTWRIHEAALPHARKPPNSIYNSVIAGLSILDLQSQTPQYWSTLSSEDARRAAICGMNELNGFADWLPALCTFHIKEVTSAMREGLSGEYALPEKSEQVHGVTANLASRPADDLLVRVVGQHVTDLLLAGDPANGTILRYLLRIMVKNLTLSRERLASVCKERIGFYRTDQEQYTLWLTVWIQVNALAALDHLDTLEGSIRAGAIRNLCGGLGGDDRFSEVRLDTPDYMRVDVLRRFLPPLLVLARTSDPSYVNGSFPERTGRMGTYLIEQLSTNSNPEALKLLQDMQRDPLLQPESDWLTRIVDHRIYLDSEALAWEPQDTASFGQERIRDPRNAQELFERVSDALETIEFMIQQSDGSWRNEIIAGSDETELRLWLAGKLRQVGSGKYVPYEEPQDARNKRADIRLEFPNVAGRTTIELKWAQNWSLNEHLERLENQLFGQYLKGESRHGVYLMMNKGPRKKSWGTRTDGESNSLDDLARAVREKAISLTRDHPGTEVLVMAVECG